MRAAHALLSLPSALAIASAALAACVREGAPVVAPVDISVESSDAGPAAPLVIAPPVPATRDHCTARLRPGTIQTNPSCTLDERLSRGNGMLLYPCSGDGSVEAVFAEHRFVGKLTGTSLVLALTTELDWEDGCHWETKQGLRGELHRDEGGSKRSKLAWTYSERPVSGPNGSTLGCYGTCRATADIEIDDITIAP
jgi:hypothetical protein